MKVWITKYALSLNVFEMEADEPDERAPSMIVGTGAYRLSYFHGEGQEWHRTRDSAISKAEEMRKAKIASLKKQIEKLEKLKFSASEVG